MTMTRLHSLADHARIILRFWQAGLIQAMEYRASFVLSIVANAVDFTFGLVQYALLFSVAETIAGWEQDQMLAFYGVFMTIFALHFIFLYPNLDEMNRLVNSGKLDLVLSKPVSAQLLLSFRRLSFEECGSLATALSLLIGLWATGRLVVTPPRLFGFLAAVTASLTLVYALFLGLLALTIRLERLESPADLMWSFFGLCRYPVDVFPRRLRWVFLSFVPIAFVSTVPARALAMGEDPGVIAIGFLLACLFLALARLFWLGALRAYTSAGG